MKNVRKIGQNSPKNVRYDLPLESTSPNSSKNGQKTASMDLKNGQIPMENDPAPCKKSLFLTDRSTSNSVPENKEEDKNGNMKKSGEKSTKIGLRNYISNVKKNNLRKKKQTKEDPPKNIEGGIERFLIKSKGGGEKAPPPPP